MYQKRKNQTIPFTNKVLLEELIPVFDIELIFAMFPNLCWKTQPTGLFSNGADFLNPAILIGNACVNKVDG